jgi:WD40 repeat protein
VRLSPHARLLLGAPVVLCLASARPFLAQPQPGAPGGPQQEPYSQQPVKAQQPPVQQPPSQQPNQPTSPSNSQAGQAKKPIAGPAAPQSTHYPILLLVQGPTQADGQTWTLRIGLRGPERLDRTNYPPIPLEPAEVVREGTTDSWIYRAKDTQTGAAVLVHITRESCTDAASTAKFAFTASVQHAQIGSAEGCARVATELFPKINNQPTDDDDDAKDKPAPPTITQFKPPVYVAYINASGKLAVKRGAVARAVPGKGGYQPALSHDGKRLLYTTDEKGDGKAGERTISIYDWTTGKSTELLGGSVQQAFWSPDDTRIAFLKFDGTKWQVWAMPSDAPEKAALVYPGEVVSLHGWTDAQTILVGDLQTLFWIGEDGTLKQSLASADLYGKDQFSLSSANAVRVHPLNPDLLLVSAELLPAPPTAASKNAATPGKDTTKDPGTQPGQGFFLYELESKRRVLLSPPNMTRSFAEWSRDGLQIFFTCREPSSTAMTIYKMFWDGTSQSKVQDGYGLVIGQ